MPDPNTSAAWCASAWRARRNGDVELTHGYDVNSRGLGAADMALAVSQGRPQRASGDLAMHVLDLMCSFQEASESERHVRVATTCERPEPLPAGLKWGELA